MNATLVIVKKLKKAIAKLNRQIAIGIKNARKYILELIDAENKLKAIQTPPVPVQLSLLDIVMENPATLSFSEDQIKSAFREVAGDFRYWKPEMVEIIPTLIGLPLTNHDSWEWWVRFEPIQKAEGLGWKDRVIALAIDTAKLLGE